LFCTPCRSLKWRSHRSPEPPNPPEKAERNICGLRQENELEKLDACVSFYFFIGGAVPAVLNVVGTRRKLPKEEVRAVRILRWREKQSNFMNFSKSVSREPPPPAFFLRGGAASGALNGGSASKDTARHSLHVNHGFLASIFFIGVPRLQCRQTHCAGENDFFSLRMIRSDSRELI